MALVRAYFGRNGLPRVHVAEEQQWTFLLFRLALTIQNLIDLQEGCLREISLKERRISSAARFLPSIRCAPLSLVAVPSLAALFLHKMCMSIPGIVTIALFSFLRRLAFEKLDVIRPYSSTMCSPIVVFSAVAELAAASAASPRLPLQPAAADAVDPLITTSLIPPQKLVYRHTMDIAFPSCARACIEDDLTKDTTCTAKDIS